MQQLSETERIRLPPGQRFRPSPPVPPAETPIAPPKAARRRRSRWREGLKWALSVAVLVVLTPVLLGISLLAAIYWQARTDPVRPSDAIVVLGTTQYDGSPGPVLRARLDHALGLYGDGLAPLIVLTGGRQAGDRFTEAEAGRDYLVDRGVPSRAILLENSGRSSWESMQGVAALLKERGLDRILLVSDGFHLFRLKQMAHDLGLHAVSSPVPNSPIRRNSGAELGYLVREAGAFLFYLSETR